MRLVGFVIQISCLCLAGAPALASSPSGVWSLPDSVTILDADEPQPMVVIEGLFTVWSGDGPVGGDWGMAGYEDAAWGVMVYRCKVDEKSLCLMQWGEIGTAASDDACVGWGDQESDPGSVRETDDTTSPDPYPLALGVVTGVTPCSYLATIPPRDPPVEPAVEDLVELPPEPGPEVGPEGEVEPPPTTSTTDATSTTDVSVTTDASTATSDTATTTDTGVGGSETEGGGCAGGPLGLAPGLLAGLAVALARRRRA